MRSSEDPISKLQAARARAERLNAEYRDSVAAALEQAARTVREGGDVDQVLQEVRLLLPPPTAAGAAEDLPPIEPEADERPETEVVKGQVRAWYLALPQEVRTSWSDRQIVEDPSYQPELESLTGRKWDTVRTRYLAPLRKELGEGPQPRRS
ncbi:hypothetical protein [Streptomyces sp. V3I7]|uniref:hypothetical protein n=1 Tax=Streptomyces sp. V3I7 TaxID=3042278 RepID=UPI0027832DF9|nr:hypothetical protein [Streptomyces sp. V3I7]MDQ0994787.1 hypothetical protein [Streptomyces sp. V3I7]